MTFYPKKELKFPKSQDPILCIFACFEGWFFTSKSSTDAKMHRRAMLWVSKTFPWLREKRQQKHYDQTMCRIEILKQEMTFYPKRELKKDSLHRSVVCKDFAKYYTLRVSYDWILSQKWIQINWFHVTLIHLGDNLPPINSLLMSKNISESFLGSYKHFFGSWAGENVLSKAFYKLCMGSFPLKTLVFFAKKDNFLWFCKNSQNCRREVVPSTF